MSRPTTSNVASKRMYTNTVIFTVFAGIISGALLLLLLLMPGIIAGYTPLVVTVQLGLLAVVIWAVVVIILRERSDKKAERNALQNRLAVLTCPDYWTLTDDPTGNGRGVCMNTYVTPSAFGDKNRDNSATFTTQSKRGTVNLAEVNDKSLAEACKVATALGAPWTDLRAMCDSYRA